MSEERAGKQAGVTSGGYSPGLFDKLSIANALA
jgi:hypothetical protein